MPVTSRSKLTSFALKTLTAAVASAVLLSSAAHAAGLGKLTVLSSLGQPLNAEIELTSVSGEESNGLVAKLAPTDAFRLANIEYNPALSSLRFQVEQRGTRQFIKITSAQPVNEPFVDMLLELSWGSGRLVREYTFLLDPADMRTTQSAQVSAPVDVLSQGARPTAPAARTPAPRPAASAAPAATPAPARPPAEAPARASADKEAPARGSADKESPARAASDYKVKRGDTLSKIAGQVKPVDISLDMMLVALYRANPDAFSGNNMNRLKSGQILAVPDSAAIKGGASDNEARGVVVAHAADFNAYRNKLAGQVATAAPDKGRDNTQSAAGKISAKVQERPTAANESKDQLKLSKAAPAEEKAVKSAPASAEDKIAKERALADAAARVKELERNVSDLEKLMVVKNKAGSEAAKPTVAEVVTPSPAASPAVVEQPAKPSVAPVPPPIKTAPKKVAPPVAAEPGIAEMVMDNITTIGAGIAVLLLGLFGISAMRKRKAAALTPVEPSILGAPTDQAHSLFAETGGQSVDTSNSVFNSSFAPSASQLDTNEVDPVAEADVYIAYGRDAQAEEILKEALKSHPERYPVRLKLLEIYAARKDLRAFENQATEMYAMTRGQGDDWAQAAALGLSIDPGNPLYAGAIGAAPVAPELTAEQIAEQVMLTSALDHGMDLDPDATALPAAAPLVVSQPAPTPADDDHTLDFDLGGLSFEPISPAATPAATPAASSYAPPVAPVKDFSIPAVPSATGPITTPAPATAPASEEPTFDMSFDMDFDKPAATPAVVPAVSPSAAEHAKALDDIDSDLASHDLSAEFAMADLAHDFDLPSAPPAASSVSLSKPEPAGNNTLMDLDAMDFNLPSTPAAAPVAPAAPADDEEDFFALPDLMDEAPAAPAATSQPTPQFDMSGIDLDLPSTDSAERAAALPDLDDFADREAPALPEHVEPAELSAVQMEMETKLDLAIAYQEIGDKEGARELLDEVIKGGSGAQITRANDMRAKLA